MDHKDLRRASDARWGYFLVAPTIIGLLVLNIWPFIQTVYLSFTNAQRFGSAQLIGLQNYGRMFQSSEFWQATWNSVYFCILTVPIGIFLSLLLAVALNSKIKGKVVFRAIYFLPMVVAPVAVAMVWNWMFNSDYGIINQVLGGAHIYWLTNPHLAIISCAIVSIWSAVGYDSVLLLAGLQNIPKTLYEAANLDGATSVQQFFKITLPMVSPTLFMVMIMRLMSSLKVYDIVYMMVKETNPALLDTQTLMYLFYRESFTIGNKGYGSAIAVWTVFIIGIVTVIQFWGQNKWVTYDI